MLPAPINFIPFSNKVGNDHFSRPIPLPFPFDFYGTVYNSVVVGANGRLLFGSGSDFNDLHTAKYVDKVHSGNDASSTNIKLPSEEYLKLDSTDPGKILNFAQIFFGFTDLGYYLTTDYNNLTYGNVTIGGKEGILFHFKDIRERIVAGGYSSVITAQVLLLEDHTVRINVVKNSTSSNAIIGFQNSTGTLGAWYDNNSPTSVYNNGKWTSNGNSSWVFTPNMNLTPQFEWSLNGTPIPGANTDELNFIPTAGGTLKVEVTYHDPSGIQVGPPVSDDITFTSMPVPVVSSSGGGGACTTGVTLSVSPDPALSYQWFRSGDPTVLGTGPSYFASENGDYYVTASRISPAGCSVSSAQFTVSLSSTLPPFNQSSLGFYFCGDTPTKNVNLYDYYPSDPTKYTLSFYSGTTLISNPGNFLLTSQTDAVVKIEVNDPVSGCNLTHTFTLRYDAVPPTSTHTHEFCHGTASIDASNPEFLTLVAGSAHADFNYLYSTDGVTFSATSTFNPLVNSTVYYKIIPKTPLPAGFPAPCETVSKIIFTEKPAITANAPTTVLEPQCFGTGTTFDLASLISEINPAAGVTVTFHTSLSDAQAGTHPVNYSYAPSVPGVTTLYIRVLDDATECTAHHFPNFTVETYPKPTLTSSSITVSNCAENAVFDLTQNISSLYNSAVAISAAAEYYAPDGTLLSAAEITAYNATLHGNSPYIRLIYNSTCYDIITFNLNYNPLPAAISSGTFICGETSYSLSAFKALVASTPANYDFTDASGNPLPASFNLAGTLPLEVEYYMTDKATDCRSALQTFTFSAGNPTQLLTDSVTIEECDAEGNLFDGIRTFSLDSRKTSFITDPSAVFEYFSDAALTKPISAAYLNETAFSQVVYVKITAAGFCPTVAEINLKANIPTRSTTLQAEYFICFGETLTIDAGAENVSWTWSSGGNSRTQTFTQPGAYSVILTNSEGCAYTHDFIISDENQPKITEIKQSNAAIEVIAEGGTGPYTYYFNGVPQSSNILLIPGESSYEIQVESATGCFGPPKTVFFISVKNAFTPNGDGINDYWSVENLDQMDEIQILVSDRNGRTVFRSDSKNSTKWDGTHGGRALPTDTYWYVVKWFDPVTQKSEMRQGWVLLKNRN